MLYILVGTEISAVLQARAVVDKCCLNLCISLLDHDLTSDLFESAVIRFLAVEGIDVDKKILRDTY